MRSKNLAIFVSSLLLIVLIAFVAVSGVNLGGFKIQPASKMLKLGLDIEGGVVVVYQAESKLTGTELKKVMDQTKGVIERRINALGLTEPIVTVSGTNRIRVELPGVKNADQAINMIGKTAKLEFLLVDPTTQALEGMKKKDFKSIPILTGSDVKDAGYTIDKNGQPSVSLKFNGAGTKLFADGTQKATNMPGGRGQIAIVLDDTVISAPYTAVVIPDGSAIITGKFTTEDASQLGSLIRGGSLPLDLKEVQSSVIGPTLGLNALNSSVQAALIGFLLVVVAMMLYYRLPGVIATFSLILYCCLNIYLLILFKATLTLPGIAGIVLSIGVAVDANVIIFERLKEELRNEKTLRASIEASFRRAFMTILDSNITTVIAAVVLFNFGEGPIKGFAITLMVGIVCSMFASMVVTRALLKSMNGADLFTNLKLYKA